jgi:type II secretory pathway pseudopilin PulG
MRHKPEIIITLILTAALLWVAVPNLQVARNRARQKRTMADIRTISTAWEARATDLNSYTVDPDPRVGAVKEASDFSKLHHVSAGDLKRALVPRYLKEFPARDGWGNEFEFRTGDYLQGAAQTYALRSPGSDAIADARPYTHRATSKFEEDIVFANGVFLQFPEGV